MTKNLVCAWTSTVARSSVHKSELILKTIDKTENKYYNK